MTVEKILCVGGVLLIPGHESKAMDQMLSVKDERVVSQSFEEKVPCTVRSSEGPTRNQGYQFPLEYPKISPTIQIEELSHRQDYVISPKKMVPKMPVKEGKFVFHRPLYRGEKRSLTPPSGPKPKSSWSAPAQKWQGLNMHHHNRKFDRAYIRSKTRG